jgi:hypothetical protein
MINKRKAARVSTLADSATSGSSSPKSGARKQKSGRRSTEDAPSTTNNFSEAAEDQVAIRRQQMGQRGVWTLHY